MGRYYMRQGPATRTWQDQRTRYAKAGHHVPFSAAEQQTAIPASAGPLRPSPPRQPHGLALLAKKERADSGDGNAARSLRERTVSLRLRRRHQSVARRGLDVELVNDLMRKESHRSRFITAKPRRCPIYDPGAPSTLTLARPSTYTRRTASGGVAQLGERYNRTVEVGGSNPPASTTRKNSPAVRPGFSFPLDRRTKKAPSPAVGRGGWG